MKLINPEVRIENCSFCNSKCTICPREKMTRKQMIMPHGHFCNLVDQAKDLGAELISIFGYGEPFMDKEIIGKIQYCTDKELDTFITTNGSLLNVNVIHSMLEAGLKHIRFSVHGIYANYEKVHRGLKFDTVYRNISNTAAWTNARYNGQCKISISVIPMHNEDIEQIKYTWKDFELEIWKPHNWTNGRDYRGLTKERKKTCGRPFSGPIQVNADGKQMVCCFDYNAEMTVGDTYKNTIAQIIRSDAFNLIRVKHADGKLGGLPCESCDQLNIGDNPLLYSTIDPTCEVGKTSSTKFKLEVTK